MDVSDWPPDRERKEIGAPGEFDNITDDELKRAIIDRFVRLGLGRVMSALCH